LRRQQNQWLNDQTTPVKKLPLALTPTYASPRHEENLIP